MQRAKDFITPAMQRVESFCRPFSFRRCGVLAALGSETTEGSAEQIGLALNARKRWLPKR
jgi:hypothetical protein